MSLSKYPLSLLITICTIQGRILPVPETVPFRLTRGIVDGMGITGTEGVFCRCCEFTLSVLRAEKESIITILDVLRYDPLYSWTISPVRKQRMQRDNEDGKAKDDQDANDDLFVKPDANQNEEAEAERALAVVNKKLTQTLSVGATVNELIQQAVDVKNLAVLYSGEFDIKHLMIFLDEKSFWLIGVFVVVGWGAYA